MHIDIFVDKNSNLMYTNRNSLIHNNKAAHAICVTDFDPEISTMNIILILQTCAEIKL